jgi:hypothetical protein
MKGKTIRAMTEREITRRLDKAITKLFKRDLFLLRHRTSERALVAKLASYMTPLFPDYDVDVDYNRQGLNPNNPKELTLPRDCRGGGKKKRVFPDIIVHRRGDLLGHNLLVVEVKRNTNKESRNCDRAKIVAMKRKYHYRFGMLLEVPSGNTAYQTNVSQEWR